VLKVLSLATHLLMRLRQQLHLFASAIAALLTARDTPLGGLEAVLRFAIPAGVEDARAIRKRGERLKTKIHARLVSS
jgi:hypothetical protein